MAIYLYNNSYVGLSKDCDEYKSLRIQYLTKYKDAIINNNLWVERHYFQKLLTCIKYNNFPERIVERLHIVFNQRAKYLSLYYYKLCDEIKQDNDFIDDVERNEYIHSLRYSFTVNSKQQWDYIHNFNDDFRRLFKAYEYNGFASKQDIDQYKESLYLFKSTNVSKMESEMIDYFKNKNIEYTREKTFSDLKSPAGAFLRFDCCIKKNGQMLLFECQGLQHYKPIDYFGGEKQFLKQKLYDNIKKQYCIKNNIPLLYIRYNQNVTTALKKFLSRKNYKNIIYEYD